MMWIQRVTVIGALLVATAAPGISSQAQSQPPADVQLRAARQLEEVTGDLKAAIEAYRKLSTNPDRAIAAEALLRMAGCQEKLGQEEARRTYQQVISRFADQEAAVLEARRLLRSTASPASPNKLARTRQVLDRGIGNVSADGRFSVNTDSSSGNLVLRDIGSGREQRLTTDAASSDTYDLASLSPDDTRVAFRRMRVADGQTTFDVRILTRSTGATLVVHENNAVPMGWSADGALLLLACPQESAGRPFIEAALVTSATGAKRVVKRFDGLTDAFRLSPDGRFVAYQASSAGGTGDLRVVSTETGDETVMLSHPADEVFLEWFPNGNQILFLSDRDGTYGLWMGRVESGVVRGEPQLVRPGTGKISSHGLTRGGELYFSSAVISSTVFIADLDRESAAPVLTQLEGRLVNGLRAASYSTDGSRIAYIQELTTLGLRGTPVTKTEQLAVQSVAGGNARFHRLDLRFPTFAWMPDGRGVVIAGAAADGSRGLFRLDLESERLTPLVVETQASGRSPNNPWVSPDGLRVLFSQGGSAGLVSRDIASGVESQVYRGGGAFVVSPDGQWIAVLVPGPKPAIRAVPTSRGESKMISSPLATWNGISPAIGWSADSRAVFVGRQLKDSAYAVWRIPVDGAEPVDTGIRIPGPIQRFSAHPGGRWLAISATNHSPATFVLDQISAVR